MLGIKIFRTFILLLALACLLHVFAGCHKNKSAASVVTTTTGVSPDSTYVDGVLSAGCYYAGNCILFYMNVVGPGKIAISDAYWTFGDGTASNEKTNVKHIYNSPGTYVVTLSVNGAAPVSKTITVTAYSVSSAHTAQMAGTKTWRATGSGMISEYNIFFGAGTHTIDIPVKIEIVNQGMVELFFFYPDMIFNLIAEDTVNKVLTFKDCLRSHVTLYYHYDADSLVYTSDWWKEKRPEHFVMHCP